MLLTLLAKNSHETYWKVPSTEEKSLSYSILAAYLLHGIEILTVPSAIWNSSNFLLASSEARNTTWNVIWNRNTFVGFFFFHFSCFTRTKYKQKIVFSPADFSLSVYMENFACVLRIRKGWSWEIKFKTVENTCKITIPVTDLHTFSLLIYKCSNYVRSTSAVCAIYDYSLCKYGKRYSSGNMKVWSCKKHFRISKILGQLQRLISMPVTLELVWAFLHCIQSHFRLHYRHALHL